jgi:hypothetical protein
MLTSSKNNFYLKKLNNFIDFLSHLTKILFRKKKNQNIYYFVYYLRMPIELSLEEKKKILN